MPRCALWVFFGLCAPTVSVAQTRYDVPGELRMRVESVSDSTLDDRGTRSGGQTRGRHRLRIDPTISGRIFDVRLQLDLQSGQSFGEIADDGATFVDRRDGDPLDRYDGWQRFLPRQAWFELRTPVGIIRAGQMASQWGLGLVAHDGEREATVDDRGRPRPHVYGDPWTGDLVDRVLIATRPFAAVGDGVLAPLTLALGADSVWEDDNANVLDGDEAYQLVGSLFHRGRAHFLGTYGAWRTQTDADGETLEVLVSDAFARGSFDLPGGRWALTLEGEAALVTGETTRLRTEAAPGGVEVLQLGGLARIHLSDARSRWVLALEGGYASGDANVDDERASTFAFDQNHRVGLVLFPELLRRVSLVAAERAADPARAGQPPSGVDQLPTDGAVRNAVYAQPSWTWRPGRWTLATSALFAWAASAFEDPASTFETGGFGRNPWGEPAARFYGVELDAAALYRWPVSPLRSVEVGIEGGVFMAGAALEGLGQGPESKVSARVDVAF